MTLRKIIAVLFALGYCLTAAAAVVEGVVADRTTREPLIGATVLVEGTTKGTTTDAQGHFGLDLPGRKPYTGGFLYFVCIVSPGR